MYFFCLYRKTLAFTIIQVKVLGLPCHQKLQEPQHLIMPTLALYQ